MGAYFSFEVDEKILRQDTCFPCCFFIDSISNLEIFQILKNQKNGENM